jgi:hypothetical protein
MSRRTSLATRKQRGDAEELRKHVQIGQLIDRLIAYVCSPKPLMDESPIARSLSPISLMTTDTNTAGIVT